MSLGGLIWGKRRAQCTNLAPMIVSPERGRRPQVMPLLPPASSWSHRRAAPDAAPGRQCPNESVLPRSRPRFRRCFVPGRVSLGGRGRVACASHRWLRRSWCVRTCRGRHRIPEAGSSRHEAPLLPGRVSLYRDGTLSPRPDGADKDEMKPGRRREQVKVERTVSRRMRARLASSAPRRPTSASSRSPFVTATRRRSA